MSDDFDLGRAMIDNQKRLFSAVSPYLERPVRSPERAALDEAVRALKVIAKPTAKWTPLESLMQEAAQVALDRIKALVPEAVP